MKKEPLKEFDKKVSNEEMVRGKKDCNLTRDFVEPLHYAALAFGGKWKSRILCVLYHHEPLRYNQIRNSLDGITDLMLSKSLKELVSHGLIERHQYPQIPPKVEYTITDKGRTVIPLLADLVAWGAAHRQEWQENKDM